MSALPMNQVVPSLFSSVKNKKRTNQFFLLQIVDDQTNACAALSVRYALAMLQGRTYLLYDYLQVAGGAERLSLDLAAGLPAELVVSRVFAAAHKLQLTGVTVLGNRATRWLGRLGEALYVFMRRPAFLQTAETVIYSGFYAPLAVRWQKTGRKIYYCHTPPRFAFDLQDAYLKRCPFLLRPALQMAIALYRRAYLQALGQMDVIISNSVAVEARLKAHTGFSSLIIHPPVAVDTFQWQGDQGYYVSLARLEPRKRVSLLIEAFKQMPDRQLVVMSGGSQAAPLRAQAAGAANIRFTDWQTEEGLHTTIGQARAALYLADDEDFGMSPVEAMAAGKPVIGVAAGGLLETIVPGQTGLLLPAMPSVADVIAAVRVIDGRAADMRAACEVQAQKFSREIFIAKMRALVDNGK